MERGAALPCSAGVDLRELELDAMKSMCTSLALLTVALGSYMSSLIYAAVDALTATGGRPGWIADDLDEGHLDYFF